MTERIQTLRRLAAEHDADGVLITHPTDVRWGVGFTGSNGVLAVTESRAEFVTDGRYTAQAASEVVGASVHIAPSSLTATVAGTSVFPARSRIVVQADRLTIAAFRKLEATVPDVAFVPVADLLVEVVAAKTEAEVEAVRQAQALTCDVFTAILPHVRLGVTEQALAARIVHEHLLRGASAMSFQPIVASGPNGALPHARPGSRAFEAGDLVVLDMGGMLNGYSADLSRTVAIGEPSAEARQAYDVVRAAQHAAIGAARAGMTGRDLDTVARSVIENAGLGDAFTHSLGHGVGLDVHEWPRLSQQVEHVLPAGATVTIEPGVYLENQFGIRIEDIVVLREGGCENLTPLPTDLLVL